MPSSAPVGHDDTHDVTAINAMSGFGRDRRYLFAEVATHS
jgi:hypothetical protein